MAKDKTYAMHIYKKAKEALIKSQWFDIDNEADIKIVAIECSPALSAVILPKNLILNHPSKRKEVSGAQVTQEPIIRYLSLNCNQFDDKGNMKWDNISSEKEARGGLDYYFPKGWKGYGLKVLGKYGLDNNWLQKFDKSGWAVAYHGVSQNPKEKIKSILSSQLNPGQGQAYKADQDSNSLRPCDRSVGVGIYFARKIQISENYSEKVEVEGKKYKVLLQCRLNPSEVRIPKSEQNYYVVPDGSNVRPYRILVKEFTE